VVVADNGSTDGSLDIANRWALESFLSRLLATERAHRRHFGGTGRYVIFGDADDSYDFTDLAPFLLKLREGYELVMGNRFLGEYRAGAMPPCIAISARPP